MGLGLVGVWVTFLISSLEAIGQIWQKVSVQVKGSFEDFMDTVQLTVNLIGSRRETESNIHNVV